MRMEHRVSSVLMKAKYHCLRSCCCCSSVLDGRHRETVDRGRSSNSGSSYPWQRGTARAGWRWRWSWQCRTSRCSSWVFSRVRMIRWSPFASWRCNARAPSMAPKMRQLDCSRILTRKVSKNWSEIFPGVTNYLMLQVKNFIRSSHFFNIINILFRKFRKKRYQLINLDKKALLIIMKFQLSKYNRRFSYLPERDAVALPVPATLCARWRWLTVKSRSGTSASLQSSMMQMLTELVFNSKVEKLTLLPCK